MRLESNRSSIIFETYNLYSKTLTRFGTWVKLGGRDALVRHPFIFVQLRYSISDISFSVLLVSGWSVFLET